MDIIIIGAGAAGLMAARILSANGIKVVVLEARDRPGGRIDTIEEPFHSSCEAGAEFIHGNLKLTKQLLKEAGIKKTKVRGGFYTMENGKLKEEDDIVEGWDIVITRLKQLKSDMSVSKFLDEYMPEVKYAGIKQSFKKYVQGYDSADVRDASAISVREEMENEEDDQYRINNGYGGLINFLAAESKKNACVIHTSEVVKQVNWQKNNVEVITDRNTYKAQKVIITVPIGVLQLKENEPGAIRFHPEIIEKQKAINNIGFGWVIKILIEFDEAFWFNKSFLTKAGIDKPFFIFSDAFIPTWWTQLPDERPLLVGWLAGPGARDCKDMKDDELLNESISSLSKIFDISDANLRQKMKAHKICNWVNDPFCRGAYSYSTVTTKAAVKILKKPIQSTIYFAGEALGKSGTATVDTAFESGKEIAGYILKGK